MSSIAIHDIDERNVLAFDLHELLDALGPDALSAAWRARGPISYIASVDIPCLEIPDRSSGPWMPGATFRLEIENLGQTIDGVFEAKQESSGNGQERWIVLRAVDSSWWEVYTDDEDAIATLRQRFRDIRPAHYTADTVY